MDAETKQLHLDVSRLCGKNSACGNKIDYQSEATAQRSADVMLARGSKNLEPYPCYWCNGWHIGGTMTVEELKGMLSEIRP